MLTKYQIAGHDDAELIAAQVKQFIDTMLATLRFKGTSAKRWSGTKCFVPLPTIMKNALIANARSEAFHRHPI